MWPAIIFAHNRSDKVIGRIKTDTSSTQNKNIPIKAPTPVGIKREKNPNPRRGSKKINEINQKKIAAHNLNQICLEKLKKNGTKPIKFTSKTKQKNPTNVLCKRPHFRKKFFEIHNPNLITDDIIPKQKNDWTMSDILNKKTTIRIVE